MPQTRASLDLELLTNHAVATSAYMVPLIDRRHMLLRRDYPRNPVTTTRLAGSLPPEALHLSRKPEVCCTEAEVDQWTRK